MALCTFSVQKGTLDVPETDSRQKETTWFMGFQFARGDCPTVSLNASKYFSAGRPTKLNSGPCHVLFVLVFILCQLHATKQTCVSVK